MATAFVFTEYGGPEVQAFAELPDPTPGPGEVTIQVGAAAVNPVDWKIRAGWYRDHEQRQFPSVLGRAVAGVVHSVGEGVTDLAVGEEVFGVSYTGGYTTRALAPAEALARQPSAVSFIDAASLPVSSATAYDALTQLALPAGSTLLVAGAGGGIGVPLLQLARRAGLTVVGTASSGKADLLAEFGATHVSSEGPPAEVSARIKAAAADGVDGVVDLVGGEALGIVAQFAPDGRLISAGDEQVVEYGGAVVDRDQVPARDVLDALASLVEQGELVTVVRAYPFAEAAAALADVEAGHTTGRAVLQIG